MKYVRVYLIKEKAKRYQIGLINEISKKFGTENLNKTIVPHLTLKYFSQPINKNKINELEKVLENFSKNTNKFNFDIKKFGNFDKKVIFTRASSKNLDKFYGKFTKKLNELEWIKWENFEKGKHNFHATLCYTQDKNQFKKINKYLSDRNPDYKLKFDNITILKKPKNKWIVQRTFSIK